MSWKHWIKQVWPALVQDKKLEAPHWLGHPKHNGFKRLEVALPSGQRADWGLSYSDGSRVHVQEFSDGRLVVHRDNYDPGRRITSAVAHLVTETPVGLIAALAILAATAEN